MRRRTLLAAVGSSLLAVSGCTATSSNSDETPENGGNTSETPTDTPAGNGQEGDAAGASFADVPCPSFADSPDRTVCSHTRASDTAVYLTVSTEVFTPTTSDDSVETMAITLHNDSDTQFGLNPHEWAIKRQTASGWTHVAPQEYVEPWYTLDAGETYTYTLSVQPHPTPQEDTHAITEDLSSGTYAFQLTGFLGDTAADGPSGDEGETTHVECIGLFNVSR